MHLSRRALVVTGVATVLLSGGTAAFAALHGPVSGGVIYGCYATKATRGGGHAIVLQNRGTACPSGHTAIQWNEQGPAGPAGPQGPAGPAASSLTIVEDQVSVPSGASEGTVIQGEADCPSGQFLLNGGFLDLPTGWAVNSASGAELSSDDDNIPGGFYFYATAESDAQGGSNVVVRAYCVPDD